VPTTTTPIRVLLVEDDSEIARIVRDGLDRAQFLLESASTLAEARQRLGSMSYDALILDLGLPDGNGLEVADALRKDGSTLPILMLTAQSRLDQRLNGFAHGADDYLCKPFSVEELAARLHALVRRAHLERQHLLRYADVELDLLRRVVRRNDLEASLSDRETALLACLLRRPEEPISRSELLESVWGDDAGSDGAVVNVYVNYLRNKLERGQYTRLIHTVRGMGYVLSTKSPD
jgi:DNA-binding response OmpR family regulator